MNITDFFFRVSIFGSFPQFLFVVYDTFPTSYLYIENTTLWRALCHCDFQLSYEHIWTQWPCSIFFWVRQLHVGIPLLYNFVANGIQSEWKVFRNTFPMISNIFQRYLPSVIVDIKVDCWSILDFFQFFFGSDLVLTLIEVSTCVYFNTFFKGHKVCL